MISGDVNINILEVKKPELDSQLVADNIAQQLEKRLHSEGYEKSCTIGHEIRSWRNKGQLQWKTWWCRNCAYNGIERKSAITYLRADVDYGVPEPILRTVYVVLKYGYLKVKNLKRI